jgi:hypothetical protein
MMRDMPHYLFILWGEYYCREPFGAERGDLQSAIVASTLANAHSDKRKFSPADFMPTFYKKQSPQDMMSQAMSAALAAKAARDRK